MMRMIVALTALTIAMPAVAKTVTCLPSDVPVTDGFQNNNVCGTCCQDGAYCGTVPEDMLLADATRPTTNLLVPKGTNMTCMLRARNVFGAVDGGLCVPSLLPRHFPIENLCRAFDQALAPSHTLTNVVYQSNLVEQETCGQCCEGYHVCGVSDVCRPISTREASYCVPSNATTHDYCGVPVLMKQKTFCESCTEASPAAEAFEAQFNVAPQISSSRRRLLSTSWAGTPSNAPSCSKDVPCKPWEACKWGSCHKKPGFCEDNRHCKTTYKCVNHMCSMPPASPSSPATTSVTPSPMPTASAQWVPAQNAPTQNPPAQNPSAPNTPLQNPPTQKPSAPAQPPPEQHSSPQSLPAAVPTAAHLTSSPLPPATQEEASSATEEASGAAEEQPSTAEEEPPAAQEEVPSPSSPAATPPPYGSPKPPRLRGATTPGAHAPVHAPARAPAHPTATSRAATTVKPSPTFRSATLSAANATPTSTAKATPVSTAKATPASTALPTPASIAKSTPVSTAKGTPAVPTPAAMSKASSATIAVPTTVAVSMSTPVAAAQSSPAAKVPSAQTPK